MGKGRWSLSRLVWLLALFYTVYLFFIGGLSSRGMAYLPGLLSLLFSLRGVEGYLRQRKLSEKEGKVLPERERDRYILDLILAAVWLLIFWWMLPG